MRRSAPSLVWAEPAPVPAPALLLGTCPLLFLSMMLMMLTVQHIYTCCVWLFPCLVGPEDTWSPVLPLLLTVTATDDDAAIHICVCCLSTFIQMLLLLGP